MDDFEVVDGEDSFSLAHEEGNVMHVASDMVNILLVKGSHEDVHEAHSEALATTRHDHLTSGDIRGHVLHDGREQLLDAMVTDGGLTKEETGSYQGYNFLTQVTNLRFILLIGGIREQE